MRTALLTLAMIAAFACAFASPAHASPEAFGLIYPFVSPDGTRVAFSYQGDIWVASTNGGDSRRLTVSIAFERSPRWSPDGRRIVFCSNRDGNYDLYVVSSAGGEVRRLTWSDANDYPGDWSPDGKRILFTTYRSFPGSQMMEIDVETGEERLVLWDSASVRYPRYSPDGKRIAFNRGPQSYTRLGYKGSGNAQVWVMDTTGSNAVRLDMSDYSQHWPTWSPDGSRVCYVTDNGGVRSLDSVKTDGTGKRHVLEVSGQELFYPSIASDGTAMIWAEGSIYRGKLSQSGDALKDSARRIVVSAGSDEKTQYITREVLRTADEAVPSPDGKWLALVIRGDIYIQPVSRTPEEEVDAPRGGEAVNFTNTPNREWQVQWHPDSDRVFFVSDKDGGQSIYELELNTRKWKRLTDGPIDTCPRLSPDGKQLAYYRDEGMLMVQNLETLRERKLIRDVVRRAVWNTELNWSPDGQWLTYTAITPSYDRDVWVVQADGSEEPRNLTQYPTTNWGPIWTGDGKNIVFASYREGEYSRLFLLPLTLPELKFTDEFKFGAPEEEKPEQTDDAAKPVEEETDAKTEPAEDEAKPAVPPVKIDFKDIEYRAYAISEALDGINNMTVSPDGKTALYQSGTTQRERKLWAVELLTGKSNYIGIAQPFTWMEWTSSAGPFAIYENGATVKINLSGSTVTGVEPVGITARTTLDRPAEILAMYDEAYRNLKYGFYDEKMHGRDMDAAYRKYRRMVANAVTHEEFEIFTTFLLGELNASHLGIWGDSSAEGITASIGQLGVQFDPDYTGEGLRVSKVLAMGPADREESRLNVGDVLMTVNGQPVGCDERVYEQLDGTINRTVQLAVQRAGGAEETVRIRPVSYSDQRNLEYEQWVRDNRKMVEELSGGRVTYLHIERMYDDCLYRFERELFGFAKDFDAVVIDVRYNGGGQIHEQLWELLGRKPYGYISRRGFGKYLTPTEMHTGPKVCLIHESSFSDAEIFPYGFRFLGFGKLVGVATSGGVIGTLNYQLLDGTTFRIPMTGRYRLDGSNMENDGVQPDIWVDAPLGAIPAGDDPQLRKAVEVVMDELGASRF